MGRAVAIVNPAAAGGRVRRRWPDYETAIRARIPDLQTRWTRSSWHAAELTQDALRSGAELVLAVGGDGTIHEAVNGFFSDDALVNPRSRLGYVPMGTGGDFQRTLKLPNQPREIAEHLVNAATTLIDVGKARFLDHRGALASEKYFINLLSFGMGGDVSVAAKKSVLAKLDGRAAFLWATLKVFFSYRGKRVQLTFDESQTPKEYVVTNVAVGNGRYHGGGMHPCPRASLTDGLLEVTTIDRLSWYELLRDLPTLYSEDIYIHPKVRRRQVRRLLAVSSEETRVEVDGEASGILPLEVTVLPGALPFVGSIEA